MVRCFAVIDGGFDLSSYPLAKKKFEISSSLSNVSESADTATQDQITANEQVEAEIAKQEAARRKNEQEKQLQRLQKTAEAAEKQNSEMQQEMKHSVQITNSLQKVHAKKS